MPAGAQTASPLPSLVSRRLAALPVSHRHQTAGPHGSHWVDDADARGLLRAAASWCCCVVVSAGQCAWAPGRGKEGNARDPGMPSDFYFGQGTGRRRRAWWLNRLHGSGRQATCNKLAGMAGMAGMAGSGSGPGWTTQQAGPASPPAAQRSKQPAASSTSCGSGNKLTLTERAAMEPGTAPGSHSPPIPSHPHLTTSWGGALCLGLPRWCR